MRQPGQLRWSCQMPPSPPCRLFLSLQECMWGNHPNEAACAAKGCCYDPGAAAAAAGQPSNSELLLGCAMQGGL
jgi:hypothetical protein